MLKRLTKIIKKGGEEKMKVNLLKVMGIMVLILGVYSLCWAGYEEKKITYTVKAYIAQQNPRFEIPTFYRITPSATDCSGKSDTWSAVTNYLIDFGTLQWDSQYKIFRGQYYGAVDVAVFDNTQTAWTITHTRTSLTKGTANLDENVNVVGYKVTCTKCDGTDDTQTEIFKKSYKDSNGQTVTRTQVSGGWLRIFYGIAGGIKPGDPNPNGCSVDAPGVKPVTMDKPYGTYQGTVTLTLSP
ncbi:MAG: hypothetical protein NC928_05925 [Candidatus Omnitrophica bacterium]|nr:hypothetical protein [Candidatus Omnitrophota bacterium]